MRARALIVVAFTALALVARADPGPPVTWEPAGAGHFRSGRRAAIDTIVIHTVEGTQQGAVATFRTGARNVSAHYVVGDDGSIVQCVKDEDTAFHAGTANARSIGIEHAGYADRPGTWTRTKYEASARLARALCDRHGIPIDRQHIIGHVEVAGATHHDPGPYFDWDLYMKLVRGEAPGTERGAGDTAPTTSGTVADQLPLPSTTAHGARRDGPAEAARPADEAQRALPPAQQGMTAKLAHVAGAP